MPCLALPGCSGSHPWLARSPSSDVCRRWAPPRHSAGCSCSTPASCSPTWCRCGAGSSGCRWSCSSCHYLPARPRTSPSAAAWRPQRLQVALHVNDPLQLALHVNDPVQLALHVNDPLPHWWQAVTTHQDSTHQIIKRFSGKRLHVPPSCRRGSVPGQQNDRLSNQIDELSVNCHQTCIN